MGYLVIVVKIVVFKLNCPLKLSTIRNTSKCILELQKHSTHKLLTNQSEMSMFMYLSILVEIFFDLVLIVVNSQVSNVQKRHRLRRNSD